VSQITGNPSAGIGGMQVGLGVNGPLNFPMFGPVIPSATTDPSVTGAANGTVYVNINGGTGSTLFCKVAGVWVNLA
jgi:hypothetical protein